MAKYADYAEGTYTKPGYNLDTQIVVNAEHPMGERIFIDTAGLIVARVALTLGAGYGARCNGVLDASTAAGLRIWDRDDQMDFYQAVHGRANPLEAPAPSIRSYKEFTTNIKNLPEGEYLTQTCYSDTHAWKVIAKTASTMTLEQVLVARDPEWKPDITPGGFVGHCNNQNDQTWLYAGLSGHTTVARLVKSRYIGCDKMWSSRQVGSFVANGAREKYDYNF